jgi:hypothetical protein
MKSSLSEPDILLIDVNYKSTVMMLQSSNIFQDFVEFYGY